LGAWEFFAMGQVLESFCYYGDLFLIYFFRITNVAFTDYYIGIFTLAFLCVIIGEISISVALRFNKRYLDELNTDITAKEALSIKAYESGDKSSYRALNKEATDAWGRQFFTMAAYSAGILWPIPFALGWMGTRFYGVEFPLAFQLSPIFGESVGYTFTFIPVYIFVRILFKYIRPWLPYFKGVQKALDGQTA